MPQGARHEAADQAREGTQHDHPPADLDEPVGVPKESGRSQDSYRRGVRKVALVECRVHFERVYLNALQSSRPLRSSRGLRDGRRAPVKNPPPWEPGA